MHSKPVFLKLNEKCVNKTVEMSPSRPYLVRAFYDWILDNECTPYVLVDASINGVNVPQDFVSQGQIVLNINTSAVHNLLIDEQGISFNARFGGVPMSVFVPCVAILAIYAKENGEGMSFGSEPGAPGPDYTPPEPPEPPKPGKPTLTVVK